MKNLEWFLKPTQRGLFKMLCKMFKNKIHKSDDHYIFVEGEVPIMLIAHLDTVHKTPVHEICKSRDGNILMSPQGIGGDDRCGVYALINAYELSDKKLHLLFTCDEEIGGIGAYYFCKEHAAGKLPKVIDELKLLVEIDRKGADDAVYYDCMNEVLEKYITDKGFKTAYGTFSDISVIVPELGVAAVNLSSGYYNPHQLHEYINQAELDAVLNKVVGIIKDAAKEDFPKYEYVEYTHYFYGDWDYYARHCNHDYKNATNDFEDDEFWTPKPLSKENEEYYYALVDGDYYNIEELEYYRSTYGDSIICELYIETFQPFIGIPEHQVVTTSVFEK